MWSVCKYRYILVFRNYYILNCFLFLSVFLNFDTSALNESKLSQLVLVSFYVENNYWYCVFNSSLTFILGLCEMLYWFHLNYNEHLFSCSICFTMKFLTFHMVFSKLVNITFYTLQPVIIILFKYIRENASVISTDVLCVGIQFYEIVKYTTLSCIYFLHVLTLCTSSSHVIIVLHVRASWYHVPVKTLVPKIFFYGNTT